MELALKFYLFSWICAFLSALFLLIKHRQFFAIFRIEYWRFLFSTWRIATFITAASAMIVVAPYSGDVTWDYFDAFFMSVLTYATAPWVMGTLYNAAKGKLTLLHCFVAVCAWLFSASWSYDLHLLLRDGRYPITWFSNLFASSVLYISAGLFWSLDWVQGRGVTFAFLERNWPYSSAVTVFPKIILYMLPFMLLAILPMLYLLLF